MKKFLLLFFSIFFVLPIYSVSDWTFLVYMEAEGELAPWALNNLNDMMSAKVGRPINILVQCHTVGDFAFRYLVKDGALISEGSVSYGKDQVQDLISAADWAFNKYKANHHSIILWNHGFGILDPSYVQNDSGEFSFEAEKDLENPICFDGLCSLKTLNVEQVHSVSHKGILFRDSDQTYLNNAQMIEAFRIIKEDILQKKIEVLGTDCCQMAMVEIGYQLKDFVDYLIGSQNCELLDGWNYQDLFSRFSKELDSTDVCSVVVDSYARYYGKKTKEDVYTLSAFSLDYMDLIADNINDFSNFCKKYLDTDVCILKQMVKDARSRSVAICKAPFYTDLDSFYTQLLIELEKNEKEISECDKLKLILKDGKDLIKQAVVANVTGENKADAKGISIYFPHNHIDSSYLKTLFAKENSWLVFLKSLMNQ